MFKKKRESEEMYALLLEKNNLQLLLPDEETKPPEYPLYSVTDSAPQTSKTVDKKGGQFEQNTFGVQ